MAVCTILLPWYNSAPHLSINPPFLFLLSLSLSLSLLYSPLSTPDEPRLQPAPMRAAPATARNSEKFSTLIYRLCEVTVGLTFQNVCLLTIIIITIPHRSIRRQVVCVHKDCAILEMVRMSAPCARLCDVRVVVKPTRTLGVGNLVFVNDD